MKTITLIRVESAPDGTFGVMLIDGHAFCVTLERPWVNNEKQVSCIPVGEYSAVRITRPSGQVTFMIVGVPNRSAILFHPGNTIEDSKGCVLLGQFWEKLRENRAVKNSGHTFELFMRELEGEETVKVNVLPDIY